MARRSEDANEAAARVVAGATRTADVADALPADVEAAWQDRIGRMQNVDARTRTLLRAAFEAGYEAGGVAASSSAGNRSANSA